MRRSTLIILRLLQLLVLAHSLDQIPLQDGIRPTGLYAELEELSRIVDISYCVGTANTGISEPFDCLSRCGEFPSFELVTTWNSGVLMTDSCGYIAMSHSPAAPRIIVAFRGTYSIANTVLDLATVPQDYLPYPASNSSTSDTPKCNNCSVHLGFYKSWTAAQPLILPFLEPLLASHPTYSLTLVGHSLGGAVAALAGLDFLSRGWDPTVTTFGQPKLGNAALAAYLNTRFGLGNDTRSSETMRFRRVTHRADPIPLLPPTEWAYAPSAGEVFINKTSLPVEEGDLVLCRGDADGACSAGQDGEAAGMGPSGMAGMLWLMRSGIRIPTRYRLWQLLFAHRDYFWRLGVCLPDMGPWMGLAGLWEV